jgi:CoA:oxalate CoA-transferase
VTTSGPLQDITVIDLTRVLAGPYCTLVLADLGARVIKIERPRFGDDARHVGPFVNGHSAYFASINRGKESIDLDLKEPGDRAILEALVDRADVLVENFRPGTMADLGYGWEEVHRRWPRLIQASLSGFGQTGPMSDQPAYDMVVQALGGVMSVTGPDGGEPTRVGTSIGDITAGLFGAVGILAALHERSRTDEGALVDVAMLDCQVAILENAIARYVATGQVPGPIGSRHPSITPFGAFRAADGFVIIAAGNDVLFRRLCDVVGAPALAGDERFASNLARCEHEAALRAELEHLLSKADVATWLERLSAADLPTAPINDVAAVLAHPQVRARNMVVPVDDPEMPGFVVAGNPIKLSTNEDPRARPAAPALGADRQRLLAELGMA